MSRSLLPVTLLFVFAAVDGAAQDPEINGAPAPVEKAPVEFFLEQKGGARGETVELTVYIRTREPLEAVSIALNFDEEDLFLADAVRPPAAIDQLAETSSTLDINNRNDFRGNQASEGWIHFQLKVARDANALLFNLGELVPLFRLTFKVIGNAKEGTSPIVFEDIPIKVIDRDVFLKNTVTVAPPSPDVVSGDPVAVAQEDMNDGAINIVGEVGFFMRGDTNYSLSRDISDPIMTLNHMFQRANPIPCDDAADANDDGQIDVSDAVFTLIRLFDSGLPFPEPELYGEDPTEDSLDCDEGGGGTT